MADQKEQTVAGLVHRFQAGADQRGADAAPLLAWRDRDWTERGLVMDGIGVGDGYETIGGVPNDLIIEQGDLREDQGVVSAQEINKVGFGGAAESPCRQFVNGADIVDFSFANDQ